jgi:GNAT superfamily N-acetyltransferase
VEVPDAVERAALFPMADLPPNPPGHPDRQGEAAGTLIGFPGGLPFAFAMPERLSADDVPRAVDSVRGALRAEGRTRGVWFVPEAAGPDDLAQRLRTLGMTPGEEPPFEPRGSAMVLIEPPPDGPPEIDAHLAQTFEEFRAAHLVSADAFGMGAELRDSFEARAELLWPLHSEDAPQTIFVAQADGEVVGFAAAFFGRTAVYLGGSGTHPDHRGRGVYRSLVRARWDAAVARSTPALTVGAGAMSRPILERLGFSIVGWFDCLFDDFGE